MFSNSMRSMLLPYWSSAVVVEEAMVSYLATLSQCTGISAHPRNTLFTGTPNNYLAVFCFLLTAFLINQSHTGCTE